MNLYLKAALVVGLVLGAKSASAESAGDRPTMLIPPQVTVGRDDLTLGDIAKIRVPHSEYQQLADDLRKIPLGAAPPPKTRTSITGARLLELIKSANIPLEAIGYSIPQIITIEREGRVLENAEVLTAVREQLAQDSQLDVQVREVAWEHGQVVPLGSVRLVMERLGQPSGGKLPLRIIGYLDEKPVARFVATAFVDDWREVPVLRRALERGMLIAADDVELVRLNLFKQPNDIASAPAEVIGRKALTRLPAGETIRKGMVDLPPVVPQGKQVKILFQSGKLSVTATGVAMDDGLTGQTIRIKNTSSRKIVNARVLNPDEVEVVLK